MKRVVAACLLIVAALLDPAAEAAGGVVPSQPNVLVIVTDDQRVTHTLAVMDELRARFVDEGVHFTNAHVTTPLCCPSRASIFTGQFVHNHGVRRNVEASDLPTEETVQAYLDQAGYNTALVGKYLNKWSVDNPAHFDRWAAMVTEGGAPPYYGATFNVDGTVEDVSQYTTDYITDRALGILSDFEADDTTPWFLYVAPNAPHSPYTPEPDYEAADVPDWGGNPATRERDRTDKPPYILRENRSLAEGQTVHDAQLRTLLSVDDMVEALFGAIEEMGEEPTLAFYISDNGFLLGEHGAWGKPHAYRSDLNVPFYMRWPGTVASGSNRRWAANIDIAPTIMDAAGLDPAVPMDGASLLEPWRRRKLLVESFSRRFMGVRSRPYQYTEYRTPGLGITFRELYLLREDPWELRNVIAYETHRRVIRRLHRELSRLLACEGARCHELMKRPPRPLGAYEQ